MLPNLFITPVIRTLSTLLLCKPQHHLIRRLRVRLGSVFCASQHVYVSPFFFFFFLVEKFDFSTNFQPHVSPVHCSWTHKFHFSATFSLKMSPTILFTHLKIILLQCFSVFGFQLYPNGPLTEKSCDFFTFQTTLSFSSTRVSGIAKISWRVTSSNRVVTFPRSHCFAC